VHLAGPGDDLQQGRADVVVQGVGRRGDLLGRHAQALQAYAVESLGCLGNRAEPMLAHALDDSADLLHRGGHVKLGTGQQAARVPSGTAQVDFSQHAAKSRHWV
jgi:hypothetical protein